MNQDVKTFTSFWIPIRLLRELENKRGKLSRNQLAVSLIEKGLADDETVRELQRLCQMQKQQQQSDRKNKLAVLEAAVPIK